MALFTSKIFVGVMASSAVTLGGLGLLFNGSETLQNASNDVKDFSKKLVQFEDNEKSLMDKIGAIKVNASEALSGKDAEIAKHEETIKTLTSDRDFWKNNSGELELTVTKLNEDIATLQTQLKTETDKHEETKAQLATKTEELKVAQADLAKAKKELANLNALLQEALKKAQQGDKLVQELEGEIKKANEEVAEHGKAVEEAKKQTESVEPLTEEEIDAIDTTVSPK